MVQGEHLHATLAGAAADVDLHTTAADALDRTVEFLSGRLIERN